MRFWFDTEFIDDTHTIELISIGIVAEDSRTYYAVSNQWDASKADPWVRAHVFPHLPPQEEWKPRSKIQEEIVSFIGKVKPEFWVYNGSYDWVAFCQLFGHIRNLPRGYPWYANEIKQVWRMYGHPPLPRQHGQQHHALADALWTRSAWQFLHAYSQHYPPRTII